MERFRLLSLPYPVWRFLEVSERPQPTAFLRGRSAHKQAGQAMAASG